MGLTPDEKRLYSQLFKSLDPEGTGIITGDKARSTFEKSGLPPAVLGEIWQMADINNLGFLTQFGFCYAMRLIGYTQSGQPPTPNLADNPGPLPKFAGFQMAPPQLQPQSTNGSFMQSQPSSIIPQNTTTYQSQPQDPIPPISSADFTKFSSLFIKTTGSPSVDLGGAQARNIFLKAKLPTDTLGQIWNLVDVENLGKLTMPAFVVAMHLIQGLLGGSIKQLPPFLPDSVWQSVQQSANSNNPITNNNTGSRQASYASISSQQTVRHNPTAPPSQPPQYAQANNDEWVLSSTLKSQYDSIFNNLDKSKSGNLSADQVAQFLMTSKLGQADLATVWDLADIQNTGVFTKLEFAIALFLVNKKLSGGQLPNIVPDSLLKSVQELENQQQPTQSQTFPTPQSTQSQVAQPAQPVQPQLTNQSTNQSKPKSSIDDLADVFGSPAATPAQEHKPMLQTRTSSSDLSHGDLPKVRKNLGGFKPTSTFGQSLMSKEAQPEIQAPAATKAEDHHDLLGDDVNHTPPASIPETSSESSSPVPKNVNYDALRAVPPPPRKTTGTLQPSNNRLSSAGNTPPVISSPLKSPPTSRNVSSPLSQGQGQSYFPPQPSSNNDLLADPAISGQLSQATSDIANISNQVKSLNTQTIDLHEKKTRAEQELNKILSIKKEIEAKLRILKSSYDNEVKQYQEVESSLGKAKEETEALRSESSIAEAKSNHLSSELNEKQVLMENLQKENGSMRERLGTVNAEIADYQKNLESILAENQRLNNQLAVQKSQVQVSLVKKQEIQSKIEETLAANQKVQEEINRKHEENQKAIAEQESLQRRLEEAKNFKPVEPKVEPRALSVESKPEDESKASKGVIGAAIVGAGAVAGGIAGVMGHKGSEAKEENVPSVEENTSKQVSTENVPAEDVTAKESIVDETPVESSSTKETIPSIQDEVIEPETPQKEDAKPILSADDKDDFSVPGAFPTEAQPPSYSQVPIEALVDEVKDKPAADMTGIEDVDNTEKVEAAEKLPETPKKLDEVAETMTNTNSSITDGETPVTSPSNSDFQFPQGGLVGMPGVLVGVQRTDSLTSSVQNNASMSVRDDNIEEVSDRDTIANEELTNDEVAASPSVNKDTAESDGDKLSSGVESFEMVNADDAKESEVYPDSQAKSTFILKNPTASEPEFEERTPTSAQVEDEFPPIKELDYDESDSSEDEDFHEAKDLSVLPATKDDFDSAFDDLEPAAPETSIPEVAPAPVDDMFADEFDNLETAKAEDIGDEFDHDQSEDFFNNDFTNSNMPDFSQQPLEEAKTGNDEWEQLFAGFGNSASAQNTPQASQPPVFSSSIHPHQHLIDELVGMGFDDKTAHDALERENWNLEAATNYLLDNA